jgi:hypothetical protein
LDIEINSLVTAASTTPRRVSFTSMSTATACSSRPSAGLLQTSIDVASLAPNAEITVFPLKEPEELKQRTINRVRSFLKAHLPMRAAAQ